MPVFINLLLLLFLLLPAWVTDLYKETWWIYEYTIMNIVSNNWRNRSRCAGFDCVVTIAILIFISSSATMDALEQGSVGGNTLYIFFLYCKLLNWSELKKLKYWEKGRIPKLIGYLSVLWKLKHRGISVLGYHHYNILLTIFFLPLSILQKINIKWNITKNSHLTWWRFTPNI